MSPRVFLFVLFLCGSAAAEPLPPRRGFQGALRTGVAIPFGQVTSETAMSDALSVQVPVIVDAGFKPIPQLFVGAFGGVAVGGAAGQIEKTCTQLAVQCTGIGFRFGLLVEVNLRPAQTVNPWLGYAIGYEIAGSSGSQGTAKVENSLRGFEWGHLLAGIDLRVQQFFGIGPFLDVALGQYSYAKSETNTGGRITALGGTVQNPAFHVWGIAGIRAVLLP